ncbi:MAG: hypothetical protein QM610_08075 [Chitinophagaceae bacterium]
MNISDKTTVVSNELFFRGNNGNVITSYDNNTLPVSKTFGMWLPDPTNITASSGTIICASISKIKLTIIKALDLSTNRIVLTTNLNFNKTNKGYYNYPNKGVPYYIQLLNNLGGEVIRWDFTGSLEFSCQDNGTPVSYGKNDYREDWFDLVVGAKLITPGGGQFIKCGYNG